MIQRIQSIWLLLAAASVFATLKFPFYSGINSQGIASQFLTGTSTFLLLATTVVVGALALINIFLYKKRSLQFRLCILGIILEALLIFLYMREVQTFVSGTYSFTAILHIIVLIAFFLAAKGIKKDAKLIRESERLR